MAKPNPVVHFEVGYNDRERMKKFYSETFGWQMQQMGPEMGKYVVAVTAPTDDPTGRPTKPGMINGGFYQKNENPLSQAPSFVIAVDDIKQAIEEVKANGGEILGTMKPDGSHSMEPDTIPGVGLWMSCRDTEGNRFSILEPQEM